MQRVMVIGGPGSGKTTLAQALQAHTGLPLYHMDEIHWKPGWEERAKDEKTAITEAIHSSERWILEGNFSTTYQSRIARADTCIWLDLPVGLRLRRVIWRTMRHFGQDRPSLPTGCPERFSWEFFDFIWRTRESGRVKPRKIMEDGLEHLRFVRLTSQSEVDAFLASMEKRTA